MKLRVLLSLALLPFLGSAQLDIVNLNQIYTVNFDDLVSGVNNNLFTGSGFQAAPVSGRLDSDAWAYTGFSSPASLAFGGTATTGDANRGIYDGISGGAAATPPLYGLYAFKTNSIGASADYCLGVAFDNAPVTITMKVKNSTGGTITVARLGYEAKLINNRSDRTTIKFAYSTDNITYTSVNAFDETSAANPTGGATWDSYSKLKAFSGLNWVNGGDLYLQWTITQSGLSNYNDPVGIDDITVQAFDAKYVHDGSTWTAPSGKPQGSDPLANAFVMYGGSRALIDSSTSLASIYLEPQARLEIASGKDLTVVDSAVLFASDNGYSQVIGEIVGKTRVESYRTTTNGRWFNFAIPVATTWDKVKGIPVATNANAAQTNLWYYDAADTSGDLSNGTWKHIADATTANTDLKGYQLYAGDGTYFGSGPFTVSASGTLVNGIVLVDVEGDAAGRFNYIGNPYPSVIYWEDVTTINGEVGPTYYMQDGEPDLGVGTVQYKSYTTGGAGDASAYIAPGQGFFITVDGTTNGDIEFRNSFRELFQIPSLFKTTSVSGLLKLSVYSMVGGQNDAVEVKLTNGYSDTYEFREDGVKMMNVGYPNIYMHADGKDLVFNALNDGFTGSKSVDVYFQGDVAGVYDISLTHDGLPAEWTVVLEDKMTSTFTNLRKSTYAYSHAVGNSKDRFVLHLNKTGAIGIDEEVTSNVFSFVTENNLTVELADVKNASISVIDMSGREVATFANASGQVNVDMSAWAHGVYLIKVNTGNEVVYSNKVIH